MSFIPRALSDGRVCCSQDYALCDSCRAYHGISMSDYLAKQRQHANNPENRHMENHDAVIDAWTPHLPQLRTAHAATATPEAKFEATWKTERAAALAAEAEHVAILRAAHEARFTTAETVPPAPNPWAADLARMRQEMNK